MFRRNALSQSPFSYLPLHCHAEQWQRQDLPLKHHVFNFFRTCMILRSKALSSLLFVLSAYLCFTLAATAQVQPGFPSFNPMDCQNGICVNPANNNVILQAPIRSKKGVIGFNSSLIGNYYMSYNTTTYQWYPSVVDSFLGVFGDIGNIPVNLSFAGSVNGLLGGRMPVSS